MFIWIDELHQSSIKLYVVGVCYGPSLLKPFNVSILKTIMQLVLYQWINHDKYEGMHLTRIPEYFAVTNKNGMIYNYAMQIVYAQV